MYSSGSESRKKYVHLAATRQGRAAIQMSTGREASKRIGMVVLTYGCTDVWTYRHREIQRKIHQEANR
jgi:hypothetical protein